MGHYCWMCGRMRPNEKFTGKGHTRHLCKECARQPREERERVRALRDIEGSLNQRNISAKNVARLKHLCKSPDNEVRNMAELVLEVARVKPERRHRNAYLARHSPDLFGRLVQQGILYGCAEEPEFVPATDQDAWGVFPDESALPF